jgi:hypothetical protein
MPIREGKAKLWFKTKEEQVPLAIARMSTTI